MEKINRLLSPSARVLGNRPTLASVALADRKSEIAAPTYRDFFVVPCRDPTSFQPFCWVVSRLAIQQPGLWLSRCSTGFWVKRQNCFHEKGLLSQEPSWKGIRSSAPPLKTRLPRRTISIVRSSLRRVKSSRQPPQIGHDFDFTSSSMRPPTCPLRRTPTCRP